MSSKIRAKHSKELNGATPAWFREWHDTEFMSFGLKVTGLLWLVGFLLVAALGSFGVMLAERLMP